MSYLMFDPIQLGFYGESYSFKGGSVRVQRGRKFLLDSYYIPYGPIIQDSEGLSGFLNFVSNLRFAFVKIDLPLILDKSVEEKIVNFLKSNGFKESEYIQDSETILVSKENYFLKKKYRSIVKRSKDLFRITVHDNISEDVLSDVYSLYSKWVDGKGFKKKPKELFDELKDKSVVSLAYDNSGELLGYVWGYIFELNNTSVMSILYSSIELEAREFKLGYALRDALCTAMLDTVAIIDFHGADRSKQRSYVPFKTSFGGEFVKLPGSFQKYELL